MEKLKETLKKFDSWLWDSGAIHVTMALIMGFLYLCWVWDPTSQLGSAFTWIVVILFVLIMALSASQN